MLSGPERVVKAPSGPLLCHDSVADPAHRMVDGPAAECFSANRLRTTRAVLNVVPVAVTAGDTIEGFLQEDPGWRLSADRAGVYSRSEAEIRCGAQEIRDAAPTLGPAGPFAVYGR